VEENFTKTAEQDAQQDFIIANAMIARKQATVTKVGALNTSL
jgi:hypothetical protein